MNKSIKEAAMRSGKGLLATIINWIVGNQKRAGGLPDYDGRAPSVSVPFNISAEDIGCVVEYMKAASRKCDVKKVELHINRMNRIVMGTENIEWMVSNTPQSLKVNPFPDTVEFVKDFCSAADHTNEEYAKAILELPVGAYTQKMHSLLDKIKNACAPINSEYSDRFFNTVANSVAFNDLPEPVVNMDKYCELVARSLGGITPAEVKTYYALEDHLLHVSTLKAAREFRGPRYISGEMCSPDVPSRKDQDKEDGVTPSVRGEACVGVTPGVTPRTGKEIGIYDGVEMTSDAVWDVARADWAKYKALRAASNL